MIVNDLFCGCGGMGLGFKQAGFTIAGAWDFDKYAIQSYKENVGDHAAQADIRDMSAKDLPLADLWTFGFPCQDISVAGKGAGLVEGKRSGLFFEVMRLLEQTPEYDKPLFILAENVKQLKKYLPIVEHEYNKQGYHMIAQLYNSKYWGVPQNRERCFILGIHNRLRSEFTFPVEQKSFVPRLSSVLESQVDEKYYISDEKAQTIIKQALERLDKLGGIHACITPDRADKRQNGRRAKGEEEEMCTLTAQDLHGVICRETGLLNPNGVAKTLRVGGKGSISKKHNYEHVLVENYRVRKLTEREYARLQGFPDDYQIVVSKSQAYKQLGNAVTVNVAYEIAKRLGDFPCIT